MVTREDWYPYIRPLALAVLLVVIGTWDRLSSTRGGIPAVPLAQEEPAAPKLSEQQLLAARGQCSRKSGEEFRRAWKEGPVSTPDGQETASYSDHYDERRDVCFFLLQVVRSAATEAGEKIVLRKMLYDANDGELYGEYRGPVDGGSLRAGMPDVCRVVGLYCASRREWDGLVEPFMPARADAP